MNPTVSVLIPVHNAESTVESAVRSILRQTLADIEIVIVNDGSTDSTPGILDRMAEQDDRIRVIHAPARGIIHDGMLLTTEIIPRPHTDLLALLLGHGPVPPTHG